MTFTIGIKCDGCGRTIHETKEIARTKTNLRNALLRSGGTVAVKAGGVRHYCGLCAMFQKGPRRA